MDRNAIFGHVIIKISSLLRNVKLYKIKLYIDKEIKINSLKNREIR